MRILNNLPALHAFTSLNKTNKALQKTISALSTGLRVNSSADDAAGFAISEKIRSQIGGLNVASRNTQDGVSLLQTAEGALGQTNSMLQRMRELALQASSDSLTSQDRQYLQLEIDELKDQIDRIANTTQFNRKRILDGSSGAVWSSDDLNLKARINRGLVTVDQFGQKVNHEGNYRIEVTAEPGEPQVQKSNIMPVAEYGVEVEMQKLTEPITQTVYEIDYVTETVTETVTELVRVPTVETITTIEEVPHIIRINEGIDSINETSGDGWAFKNGSLVITGSGTYDIRGTQGANPRKTPNIIVKSGAEAKIFLTDVHIDKSGIPFNGEAFRIEAGASAEVLLTNSNTLKGGRGHAGLEVPDGAKLKLVSADGKGAITGSLKAEGGDYAAGIGGPGLGYSPRLGRAGSIEILGGTIEARGTLGGAGIGGGNTSGPDGGGTISIYGGKITAWGATSISGAGIGSGLAAGDHVNKGYSDNTSITIYDVESLSAYGGPCGAGIGGAMDSSAGNIRINKQLFDENRIDAAAGGTGAQHIGYGAGLNNGDNNVILDEYFDDDLRYNVPDRPTIEVGVVTELPKDVYEEVTRTITKEVTRKVVRQVDKVIGERVVDTIPIIRGLQGDFVLKEKTLGEIPQFHNQSGAPLVSQPQTITITQGDGKTASVTIYETDTMSDVAKKINDAISVSLGQGKYTDDLNKFCTIADGTGGTSESVCIREPIYSEEGFLSEYGFDIPAGTLIGYKVSSTMLVRSAIPGKDGELYFSGNQDLLNALGLNTIQPSSESTFTASVYDAHSGQIIAQNVKATGQEFVSLIPPEIDIELDPMSGLAANWDENTKRFMLTGNKVYSTMLHLKNNGTIFQIGANEGEDFMIDLGDTSSSALNLSRVNVLTRETASRSIAILDRAISRISAQRAKIGSYENSLEHTMNNLTSSSSNLTAADSRIRDLDMAYGMMDFVKLQILNQSGTSMLAQANQMPNSVLSLLQN